jgi:hypothetical protein
MPIRPRLTLVTLGVADMARAVAFYDRLGWRRSGAHDPGEVAFYRLDTVILSLFPRTHLAADAQVLDTPPGFGGVTLALNQDSEAAVDAVLAEAVAAGAKLLKPGQKVFWGGYSGYFADPDGHLWEVAHNPFFPFDETGRLVLPD